MQRFMLVLVALIMSIGANVASAFDKPGFPRLGGVNNGSPKNYDDANYQRMLAKLDVAILANFPKFSPGGEPFENSVRAIKKINPNILIFTYVNANELKLKASSSPDAWDTFRAKINSMHWWLYPSGTSGSPVASSFGDSYGSINLSMNTRADSSGKRAVDWMAQYFVDNLYKPAPSIDGFFMDNVFWKPRINGDWNLDGSSDSKDGSTAQAAMRQGYARYFSQVKSLMPGKIQIGNIADWGRDEAVYPELNGVPQGGLLEGLIGKSYSVEGWGGWSKLMSSYRKGIASVSEPKILIFNMSGSAGDYRTMRYGLASCLMDDGYFAYNDLSKGYAGVAWFDEFDSNLGQATSAPSKSAWQDGVYRRDFENGIALVNPKGNGSVTVTLETDFRRLSGTQDRNVNNGQTTRTVTLADRDGIILLRTGAPVSSSAKPAAPHSVVVE